MEFETFDFEILCEDIVINHVVLCGAKLVEYIQYDVPMRDRLFQYDGVSYWDIIETLEDRQIDKHRVDREYWIKKMGNTNDVSFWGELKALHAVDYDDTWWIRFKGEDLTWNDVRLR